MPTTANTNAAFTAQASGDFALARPRRRRDASSANGPARGRGVAATRPTSSAHYCRSSTQAAANSVVGQILGAVVSPALAAAALAGTGGGVDPGALLLTTAYTILAPLVLGVFAGELRRRAPPRPRVDAALRAFELVVLAAILYVRLSRNLVIW